MSGYARTATRATGAVAHLIDYTYADRARWMCGSTGGGPVVLGNTPQTFPRCQSCDGAVFGPVLYRYFDADGRTLYIGSTLNIVTRAAGHRLEPWWPQVARLTVETFPTLREARTAEAAAIASEPSLHNRQHFAALRKKTAA